MSHASPPPPKMTTNSATPKPRAAFAIATALGLGYLPKAPGTFGSLGGVILAWAMLAMSRWELTLQSGNSERSIVAARWLEFACIDAALIITVSVTGVWAASRVAAYLHSEDPQIVVVDEVAGQLIAYLGLATPRTFSANWQYLLLGLILFRVFDIWKPFPARQAESLPGGLGIMADDWIAGVYAALVLGLARIVGL
jgi:phosphatidylglycerophosphatase A